MKVQFSDYRCDSPRHFRLVPSWKLARNWPLYCIHWRIRSLWWWCSPGTVTIGWTWWAFTRFIETAVVQTKHNPVFSFHRKLYATDNTAIAELCHNKTYCKECMRFNSMGTIIITIIITICVVRIRHTQNSNWRGVLKMHACESCMLNIWMFVKQWRDITPKQWKEEWERVAMQRYWRWCNDSDSYNDYNNNMQNIAVIIEKFKRERKQKNQLQNAESDKKGNQFKTNANKH